MTHSVLGRKHFAVTGQSEYRHEAVVGPTSRYLPLGLTVLLMTAVVAAIVFDTSLFMDFGPFTGVWLVLVVTGNVILAAGALLGWLHYWRSQRRALSSEANR